MCAPTGLCIVLILAALYKFKLVKTDVKTAFPQTILAERDIYLITPEEITNWKLL